MFVNIFADALVGSFILITFVIIFEIIFYFLKINKDIESNTDTLQNNIPDITIDIPGLLDKINIKNENIQTEISNILKISLSESIRDLVNINKENIKNRRRNSIIVLCIIIAIFFVITIILSIKLRNYINFPKLAAFVLLTLLITGICEIIFYFKIYSHLKTVNNERLLITLYNRITNNT